MTDAAQYRFLPWTRRGLAAVAETKDQIGDLPARPKISVGVTITGSITSSTYLNVYGPGDVLGIDTTMIVRTDPRRLSSDVEPNYMPAIEFDPPDLPWMFTPARAGDLDRLQPWLVLVCVDRSVVAPPAALPGSKGGGPLPVIRISAQDVPNELPDLKESWAWGHTQVMVKDTDPKLTKDTIDKDPRLNVSRLVCPRRLQPGRRYIACLVPAFDVGVFRGLTGEQPPMETLAPAWDVASPPTELVLPVYFHWEFSTGPSGDFELLASKLKPFRCPPTVGYTPMHVGSGGPELPVIAPGTPGSILDMDGALRSPVGSPARIEEVDPGLVEGLRNAVDAAAVHAAGLATGSTPVLGPPLYAEWHTELHRARAGLNGWFNHLNLDPRARVAAGLGTEVVRANQEQFMHSAWEQVGEVLAANQLLNFAALSLEVATKIHKRHLAKLANDRLLQVAQPMLNRVLMAGQTVDATMAITSLPNAAADPAMRRMTGGRHPVMRKAALMADLNVDKALTVNSTMYTTLAGGWSGVEPNAFIPDGIENIRGLDELNLPPGNQLVSLKSLGLDIEMPADFLRSTRTSYRAVRTGPAEPSPPQLRDDLFTSGVLTLSVLRELGQTPTADGGTVASSGNLNIAIDSLREVSRINPSASAFLIDGTLAAPRVSALNVTRDGEINVRGATTATTIGTVSPDLSRGTGTSLGSVLGDLEPGTFSSPRRVTRIPTVTSGGTVTGGTVADRPGVPTGRGTVGGTVSGSTVSGGMVDVAATNTVMPPLREVAAVTRFQDAWGGMVAELVEITAEPGARLVPFPTAAAAQQVMTATNPAVVIPKRIATMISIDDKSYLQGLAQGVFETVTASVMAYPTLPAPMYEYLARYDRDRFLPGVEVIPPNAITLLETNPRFIEGFMVGLNHEMNRELLWREYPTDRRGTPFRHFWDWIDGEPDIDELHKWPASLALGKNGRKGDQGQIVLLVRGDLLRRYPNTMVYAWKAGTDGRLIPSPGANQLAYPEFTGVFEPDFAFFGFGLTDQDLNEGNGWFFVLQEQPTEPRFGFDEPVSESVGSFVSGSWSNATWANTGTVPGRHLVITDNAITPKQFQEVEFVKNSGHLAAITLQKPVRVAVQSSNMYTPE